MLNHLTAQRDRTVRFKQKRFAGFRGSQLCATFSHPSGHSLSLLLCFGVALALALSLTACAPERDKLVASPAGEQWYSFQGTWTATGIRQTIRLGGDRRASISTFNGTLLLAGDSKPGVGFRAETIVFGDNATGMVGRTVWTDEHGDKVFSELRADGTSSNRIVGTFVGGTGRYAGATGTYEFAWRFLIESEDGNVQGLSDGLNGRVRIPIAAAGGPQS